jgi:hypothetical protein
VRNVINKQWVVTPFFILQNLATLPMGLETKCHCAGEAQQQFSSRFSNIPSDSVCVWRKMPVIEWVPAQITRSRVVTGRSPINFSSKRTHWQTQRCLWRSKFMDLYDHNGTRIKGSLVVCFSECDVSSWLIVILVTYFKDDSEGRYSN